MSNQEVLDNAIEMVKRVPIDDAEVVQFSRTQYDDGSVTYELSIAVPATK